MEVLDHEWRQADDPKHLSIQDYGLITDLSICNPSGPMAYTQTLDYHGNLSLPGGVSPPELVHPFLDTDTVPQTNSFPTTPMPLDPALYRGTWSEVNSNFTSLPVEFPVQDLGSPWTLSPTCHDISQWQQASSWTTATTTTMTPTRQDFKAGRYCRGSQQLSLYQQQPLSRPAAQPPHKEQPNLPRPVPGSRAPNLTLPLSPPSSEYSVCGSASSSSQHSSGRTNKRLAGGGSSATRVLGHRRISGSSYTTNQEKSRAYHREVGMRNRQKERKDKERFEAASKGLESLNAELVAEERALTAEKLALRQQLFLHAFCNDTHIGEYLRLTSDQM